VVVGREAWVCRGTFEGAARECVLWSLMMRCRLLGIDPKRYPLDTQHVIATTPRRLVGTLTPALYEIGSDCALDPPVPERAPGTTPHAGDVEVRRVEFERRPLHP